MAVILIVEDDAFIRETAELIIGDAGHQILSASDVAEALLILRSPQHVDALFTDIYLKKAVLLPSSANGFPARAELSQFTSGSYWQ